jgi:hypothetical protein
MSCFLSLALGLALIVYTNNALSWPGRRAALSHSQRRPPSRIRAASFGEYKKISCEILNNTADIEQICNVAAELMRRDLLSEASANQTNLKAEALANQKKMETEAVLNQITLEAKALANQKKFETEASANQLKLEFRAMAREALRQQQLSELSQRVVLEAFFRDVACCVKSNANVSAALSKSSQISDKAKKDASKGVNSSMSSINAALQDSQFRDAVWTALNVSESMVLPSLTNDILYGDLSGAIHSPALTEVYVRSKARKEYVNFFSVLAERFRPSKSLVLYSEENAALGLLEY